MNMKRSESVYGSLIDTDRHVLHALDYQDVTLTAMGASMARAAAREILGQHAPEMDVAKLTLHNVLSIFVDHVYWEEKSGCLLLCADLPGLCCCLPIPAGQWFVAVEGQTVH